jgi:hypothetical protein
MKNNKYLEVTQLLASKMMELYAQILVYNIHHLHPVYFNLCTVLDYLPDHTRGETIIIPNAVVFVFYVASTVLLCNTAMCGFQLNILGQV